VVNTGIFLGTGILQPLVGWVLDRGRAAGDPAGGWDGAILRLAGAAAFGAAMTLFVRETSTLAESRVPPRLGSESTFVVLAPMFCGQRESRL
jgi:hypothetical protein